MESSIRRRRSPHQRHAVHGDAGDEKKRFSPSCFVLQSTKVMRGLSDTRHHLMVTLSLLGRVNQQSPAHQLLEDLKSATGPYCRQYTSSVCFFFFAHTTDLPVQDISGDAHTHLEPKLRFMI
jgi:hypothetical protein